MRLATEDAAPIGQQLPRLALCGSPIDAGRHRVPSDHPKPLSELEAPRVGLLRARDERGQLSAQRDGLGEVLELSIDHSDLVDEPITQEGRTAIDVDQLPHPYQHVLDQVGRQDLIAQLCEHRFVDQRHRHLHSVRADGAAAGMVRRAGVRERAAPAIAAAGVPGAHEEAAIADRTSGEARGHARAIFAVGDIATGIFAMGGVARGILAFGGVAIGLLTFGGCSIGFGLAVGGLAVGGVALGGCAVGVIAVGGAAFGYYAVGGGGLGVYFHGPARSDPEAVELFRRWFGGFGAGR